MEVLKLIIIYHNDQQTHLDCYFYDQLYNHLNFHDRLHYHIHHILVYTKYHQNLHDRLDFHSHQIHIYSNHHYNLHNIFDYHQNHIDIQKIFQQVHQITQRIQYSTDLLVYQYSLNFDNMVVVRLIIIYRNIDHYLQTHLNCYFYYLLFLHLNFQNRLYYHYHCIQIFPIHHQSFHNRFHYHQNHIPIYPNNHQNFHNIFHYHQNHIQIYTNNHLSFHNVLHYHYYHIQI